MTSLPWPRRRLVTSPNGSPISRRRGTSGKLRRPSRTELRADVLTAPSAGAGGGASSQTARANLLERLVAAERAGLRVIGGCEQQPMSEHGQEQSLDVLEE